MPEPPPRPARPSFADEARRPARAERTDPLAGFAPEPLGGRSEPRAEPAPTLRMPTRSEPLMPRAARPSEPPKPPVRQERPQERIQERPPERPAAPPPAPPPAPAMSSADQNLAEMAQRLEAALRRPAGEAAAPPVAPEPPATRNEPPVAPPIAAPAKSGFENLEDEMASLLGRPKNPS
jgi:flagellar protein FliO/FliZ